MAERLILYRYTDINHGTYSRIFEERHRVLRETPRCYVIHADNAKGERFILKDQGGKRYAYADKANAWRCYQIRKKRHVDWMKYKLEHAERCHKLCHDYPDYEAYKSVPQNNADFGFSFDL